MNRRSVDIQMPVKAGRFVVGEVINGLLNQENGDPQLNIYIDASPDYDFPGNTREEELLGLFAMSAGADREEIKRRLKIAHKRNRLRKSGKSPYVYLADADVLLPNNPSIFACMINGLEMHPRLGAIGVPYQNSDHVGAGSMMLRRSDFLRIGDIGGAGALCTCSYIYRELLRLGLHTVSLKTVRAKHLKSMYSKDWPDGYGRIPLSSVKEELDDPLNRIELKKQIAGQIGVWAIDCSDGSASV